jgi:hypothetical protein
MLAAQAARNLGGETPECLAGGIDNIPVVIHLMRFCRKCPHQGNSRLAQSKSGDVTKVAFNLQAPVPKRFRKGKKKRGLGNRAQNTSLGEVEEH